MRRIYLKNNGTGNFRFSNTSSEVTATPVGVSKQVCFDVRQRNVFKDCLLKRAPKNANAYLVGEKIFTDPHAVVGFVAVHYYKIRTIH